MKTKETQLARIARFEASFDAITAAVGGLSDALDEFDRLRPELDALTAYYTGKLWKKDFADDEAGKLPKDLRRGVLSEDGVNDLLDGIAQLRTRLAETDE